MITGAAVLPSAFSKSDPRLSAILATSAATHEHLCPRQVLGARMAILAGRLLGLDLPRADKRLLVIAETDGCAADGLTAATGCTVGRRTLRVEDYGKVAATFVDCQTGDAVRVLPSVASRSLAAEFAPDEVDRWHAQLVGYQRMPDRLLLSWRVVTLRTPVDTLISRPGARARCQICGEEIINEREVVREGAVLCRACAGTPYYEATRSVWRIGQHSDLGGAR